jgi:hypothetical protein
MQGDAVFLSHGTEENEVLVNENYSEKWNKENLYTNCFSVCVCHRNVWVYTIGTNPCNIDRGQEDCVST